MSSSRTYGATGTKSKLSCSGNTITVVLGTGGPGQAGTGTGTMVWTPSSSAFDRAGNATSPASSPEGGVLDRDF